MTQQYQSEKGHSFVDVTGRIIGTAIQAHRELGPGFQKVVYQRALAWEIEAAGIEFTREVNVKLYYKGRHIDTRRMDFVVEDCIVEIKARKELLPEDFVQTLSYLKASRYRLALLLNFGAQKLEVKRFINEQGKHPYQENK